MNVMASEFTNFPLATWAQKPSASTTEHISIPLGWYEQFGKNTQTKMQVHTLMIGPLDFFSKDTSWIL